MYSEEERAKWRELVARWKAGEKVLDAGKRVEKTDATTVQRQEPVLPIKRNFIAEAQRKHAAEAVGPDTRSSYQQKQSQAAKLYANQQHLKAKDDAKRAEGIQNLLKLTQPSTYIEAITGKDLGDAGKLATDLAIGGITAVPKKISSKVLKDAAYKAAVESGNKQEAYRLLEEAYLNSGIQKTPITVTSDGKAIGWFHGSEWGNHTIFDSSAMNATIGGTSAAGKVKGNFLTTDLPAAARYAGSGRYSSISDPKTTVPTTFLEKVKNAVGKYKPRTLYPAERVGEMGPKPERLFDTKGKAPINHLDKTNNVVYPMYVNPGENPMILDFLGRPWSQSPVEFPNNFFLKRWIRDDAAKTYRNEIVPFKNKEEAMAAWEADPINIYRGNTNLDKKYFDAGERYIEGWNSEPRYETVKLVEETVPNTTNGAVQTAAKEGNSSVLMKNVIDSNGGPNGVHYPIDDLVTLKPEQMKLADITYDDAGNLIPLSQRFNWNIKDIRYGLIPITFGGTLYKSQAENHESKLPKFADGYERLNGNPVKFDEEGNLVDQVTGLKGTMLLPDLNVTAAHPKNYRSSYDPELITEFTDLIPGVGDVLYGIKAIDAYNKGDYMYAGMLGAGLAAPTILSKPLKYIGKKVSKFIPSEQYQKKLLEKYNDMPSNDLMLYPAFYGGLIGSIPGIYNAITSDNLGQSAAGIAELIVGATAGASGGYRLAQILNDKGLKKYYGISKDMMKPKLSKNSVTSEYLFDKNKASSTVSKRMRELKSGDSYALINDTDLSTDSSPLYYLQLARHKNIGNIYAVKNLLGDFSFLKLNSHGHYHSIDDINRSISTFNSLTGIGIPNAQQVGKTIYVPRVYITKK